MRKFWIVAALTGLALAGCGESDSESHQSLSREAASTLTADDLVQLKRLGFSDAEVQAEIEKSPGRLDVGDEDLRRLREAGAGAELLAHLQERAPKVLEVSDIVEMVRAGRSSEEILGDLARAPTRLRLTPADAILLGRERVPLPILLALKGDPLGAADLKRVAEAGLALEGFRSLATILGFVREALAPAEALALADAGVPEEIVAALRAGGPVAVAQGADGLQEYRHPGQRFVLRFPVPWTLMRGLDQGSPVWAATPEHGQAEVDALEVSFTAGVMALAEDLRAPTGGPVATLTHVLPLLRAADPAMEPVGEVTATRLGQLDAARQRLRGTPKAKAAGTYVSDLFLAEDADGLFVMVVTLAPEAEFDRHAPIFDRIRAASDFGRRRVIQRGATLESHELVDRYQRSVVSILVESPKGQGSGTGFVIHEKGYVATNAHVVLLGDPANPPGTRFTVQWDQGLGRADVDAELIGYRWTQSPLTGHWGVDVALLKLPPGDYAPMPLTPVSGVHLGDPVVAMGFPQRQRFKTLNMFITGGVVTRFNRGFGGEVESIYTDAKIASGSSGGPCLSRVTGGVIGLNTFGMNIKLDPRLAELNELVGYHGVVPTATLQGEFPLVADLGLEHLPELDFLDTYGLAALLLAQGAVGDAGRLAERAVQIEPENPEARHLLAACQLQAGRSSQALTTLERVLQVAPAHLQALTTLGYLHLAQGRFLEATRCAERAVAAHPEIWSTHQLQAEVLTALQRPEEALAAVGRAKEQARGVIATPALLAGSILYGQGRLEEGKREFDEACRIHPTNLRARLGVGEYYELKDNFASALLEYARLKEEFTHEPYVMTRVARCYQRLRRSDEAWREYRAASRLYKDLGQLMPEEVYFDMGRLAADERRDRAATAALFVDYLGYYRNSDRAHEVHRRLGALFRENGDPGIAFGHLCRARSLSPRDRAVLEELEKQPLRPMSLQDIADMLGRLAHDPAVVADIVRVTRLDFRLDTKNQEQLALLRRHQIPVSVAAAILDSNERVGVAAPPGGAPAAEGGDAADQRRRAEAEAAAAAQAAAALVGSWGGRARCGTLTYTMLLVLGADGSYTLESRGPAGGTNRGTFTADGTHITLANGGKQTVPYRLAGNRLTLLKLIGYTEEVELTKQGP